MDDRPWRIALLTTILPAALGLDAIAAAAGHEPVALLAPRVRDDSDERRRVAFRDLVESAPPHLDLCLLPSRDRLAPMLRAYEPDLVLCLAYPWLVPAEALAVPRLGIVNGHPSRLPRHRGPYPVAWALREGDREIGFTFHLMDEAYDTGPVLAQGGRPMPDDATFETLTPHFAELVQELLPLALARLAAGDRGDPQSDEGATYAGPFAAGDAWLDLSRPARDVDGLVRAWRTLFRWEGEQGALVELEGARTRILRTSRVDPGGGARRLECGDGPLWILESEPA